MNVRSYPVRVAVAIVLSALCGAVTSVIVILGYKVPHDNSSVPPINLQSVVEVLPLILFVALVCAVGLTVLGLPAALLMGRNAARWWMAPVMMALGAIAGSLPCGVVLGSIFGAPTGFWWWFFYRRVLIRRAALAD